MKKVSDIFKSIRFAKGEPRGIKHKSTDDEEHATVGELEFDQQLAHAKKRAMQEDLRKWFDKDDPEGGWKRINSKGEAIGPCAKEPGEPKPKCMSNEKRAKLTKKERASAVRAKRKHDSDPDRKGAPINVSNFGKGKISEDMENLNEKNVPTSPEKWAQAKAQAKAKFDVYPSAYANGWAAKKYKEMGGGWKSVSEAVKDKFDIGEYDQEGDMAKSDLRSIIANAQRMHDMIDDADNLPEWVQSKITKAEDYISTVANYMTSEMNEEWSNNAQDKPMDESVEQIDELSKGTLRSYIDKKSDDHESNRQGVIDARDALRKHRMNKPSLDAPLKHQFDHSEKERELEKDVNAASKIATRSNVNILKAKKRLAKEDVEQIEEARPSQRHPLEGHEYHKKTNAELEYIAKDAHKAAEAMKSHNTAAENKYRDQANDSATVRYYRQKHGMADWYKKKYGHMNEDIEQIEEMPGANMDTRAVHKHLRKQGWNLSRTSGSHDVYTHSDATHHIAVPRHKQLKAPLVKAILKQSEINEANEMKNPPFEGPYKKPQADQVKDKSGAVHTPMSRVKHLAKMAARRNAGIKEPGSMKKEEVENMTPAKRTISKNAETVKDLVKNSKNKKVNDDTFQSEPELSSNINKQ